MKKRACLSCLAAVITFCAAPIRGEPISTGADYDLAVYDATPAGIACAVRAAREGLKVVLVSHSAHPGGILSSGLSVFDTLYNGSRAPIYDEFRRSIYDYYRTTYGEESAQYRATLPGYPKTRYEPHVVEKLLADMLAREARLTYLSEFYPVSGKTDGALLRAVTFRAMDGSREITVRAKIFSDCSYEGDLAAAVHVPSRVGRESRAEFGEQHAGRILMRPVPWPPKDVAALAENRRLNLVRYDRAYETIPIDDAGRADPAVQAYNLRTVLADDPANRIIPDKPPAGYDPVALSKLRYAQVIGPLPNRKFCWNLPELVGVQTSYVEGSWTERRRVTKMHRDATLGLLYYLQNDPSVAEATREKWRNFGLPRDEFAANGHMPWEIYVRETRRIVGRAIFTEHDATLAPGLKRAPIHADSISATEWFLDSHACTPEMRGDSLYEGEFLLNNLTWPGQVSYRTLLPEHLDNLLVPVCLSSSHVGFGTIRLEPTWMSIAESAAYAASLAIREHKTPAAIDSDELVRLLAARGVLLAFFNDIEGQEKEPWYGAVQYLGCRGFFGTYDARPAEKLSTALAAVWIRAAAALLQDHSLDATQLAGEALAAEAKRDRETLTSRAFTDQLRAAVATDDQAAQQVDAGAAALALPHDIPISRADACRLIFALFSTSSQNQKS